LNNEQTRRRLPGDDIAERLLRYSSEVLDLAFKLPKSDIGKHVSIQLARSATASGANYDTNNGFAWCDENHREARGAESRSDFIHKLGLSKKELRESVYWLRLIGRSMLRNSNKTKSLESEGNELISILVRSVSAAKSNMKIKGKRR
jgi:hypothetical protein